MMLRTLKCLRPQTSSLSTLILGDIILSTDCTVIYVLMTPKFLSSAQTLPLNSSLIYPTTYPMFPCGSLTGISNGICHSLDLAPIQHQSHSSSQSASHTVFHHLSKTQDVKGIFDYFCCLLLGPHPIYQQALLYE